jgi:energy-coupling factor transporter ATP-binding protein EcfA2
LSKLNIITGPGNSGKSTLVNLLARAGRDPLARRAWLGQLSAGIHWFDPQPHLLRLEDRDGRVGLVHDSQRVPLFSPRTVP